MTNAPPSQNPADDGSLAGTLRTAFRKLMQEAETMLPARVLAYDRARNVATVQPMIAVLTTAGQAVSRAQVAEVPVVALGGGGFVLHFPLREGDLGWIEASDRDISLFMQSLDESPPNTHRLHSFADSRFLPDVLREFDAGAVGGDAMAIQSTDGTVRVELSPSRLLLVAPAVRVETPMATFTNEVTIEGDAIIGGIRFSTHKHLGVTPGTGTSGVPTP